MSSEEAYILIAKYLAGEVTAQEEHTLRHWVDQKEENAQLFDQAYENWELVHQSPVFYQPDTAAAWTYIAGQIAVEKKPQSRKSTKAWWKQRKWQGLVLGIGLLAFLVYLLLPEGQEKEPEVFSSQIMEMPARFPDGNTALLQPQSKVSWFHSEHIVLEGKVFIKLIPTADSSHFFFGEVQLSARHASFLVETDSAQWMIASGQVLVTTNREQIIFSSGESGHYNASRGLVKKHCP